MPEVLIIITSQWLSNSFLVRQNKLVPGLTGWRTNSIMLLKATTNPQTKLHSSSKSIKNNNSEEIYHNFDNIQWHWASDIFSSCGVRYCGISLQHRRALLSSSGLENSISAACHLAQCPHYHQIYRWRWKDPDQSLRLKARCLHRSGNYWLFSKCEIICKHC